MSKIPVLFTALMAIGVSAAASSGANDGRVPAPTTPDALVKALMAAKDNSNDGVVGLLTDESRSALMAQPRPNALHDAEAAYEEALNQRFGAGAPMNPAIEMWPSRPQDVRAALKAIQSLKIVGISRNKDGSAALRVKATTQSANGQTVEAEGSLAVQRQRGAWRIVLPDASDRQSVEARTGAMQQIVEKIRAGEYPSRQAAMIAMSNALAAERGR